MAIKITEDCINCDACISECPNHAIYEPDEEWSLSDDTTLSGNVTTLAGVDMDADEKHAPKSDEFYFIVTEKCTECKGFHDEPQCASVCPVDCCVSDDAHVESEKDLMSKKVWLHGK